MDVKPENLLLLSSTVPYHAVLTDFGSAVSFAGTNAVRTDVLGTASYVAPEVLRKQYFPTSADMWSAGITAFTLLAGDPPYDGPYSDLTLRRILTTKLIIPLSISKRCSTACQNFLMMLLRRSPSLRASSGVALDHPWIVHKGEYSETMEVLEPDDPKDDPLYDDLAPNRSAVAHPLTVCPA